MEKRIEAVVAFMETDLRLQVNLDKIAVLVNLSPSRLRHVFKEETGMSLKKYQKNLRMQKARELLEESFMSVKQIMVETGIMDRKYFARSFREAFGATPTQHRRLLAAQTKLNNKVL
jgi:two-component system response regulator YesN